jgi:hypothetical protein
MRLIALEHHVLLQQVLIAARCQMFHLTLIPTQVMFYTVQSNQQDATVPIPGLREAELQRLHRCGQR